MLKTRFNEVTYKLKHAGVQAFTKIAIGQVFWSSHGQEPRRATLNIETVTGSRGGPCAGTHISHFWRSSAEPITND